jgi:biotin synthase
LPDLLLVSLLAPVLTGQLAIDRRLLRLRGAAQEAFHETAAHAAVSRFGPQVFVRGVVEISNYCRENCGYCGMRRSNRALDRYRAKVDELAELLVHRRPRSVTDVSLQAGEDPRAVREVALPLVRILRRETSLGIIVCLGTLELSLYRELREAGADVYILKFEMADPDRYEQHQAPGTLAERVEHIRLLAEEGWFVSSGFIVGLPGQTEERVLGNFRLAADLPLTGCSVSPFVPGTDTPLAGEPMADLDLTLNCMAVLRLMQPDWIIPAVSALNLAGPGQGYARGLRAGANLVTMNLTPQGMREAYVLYRRDRFIMTEDRILAAVAAEDLTPSGQSLGDYLRQSRVRVETPVPAGG